MNCCLTFLVYNFFAGVFVFLILGIFAVTNSPFLITMNLKEKDGKKEYDRNHAILQYFIAAIFSLFFGSIILLIPKLKEFIKGKKNKNAPEKEMQIFNDNKDNSAENNERLLDDSNNSSNIIEENNNNNNNNNEEINTANTNEKFSINKTSTEQNIGQNIGMTEKIDY